MAQLTKNQQLSQKRQPMSERGVSPVHEFYIVTFEALGIGTPHYCADFYALACIVDSCLKEQVPFSVGHQFRGTLTDGNRQTDGPYYQEVR